MTLVQTSPKKIVMGTDLTPRLPAAYQEVEYIQSSGTQYIDTGMTFNQNTTIDLDISFPIARSGWNGIMGCQYRNPNRSWALGLTTATATYQQGTLAVDWAWTPTLGQKYKFTNSGNNVYIDGVNVATISGTIGSYTTPANATIFKVNYTQQTGFPYNVSASVYECKVYDNGTLVRDFIPCYRIADTEIGMYDLVNDQFYTNAGTGTFTKGNDVNVADTKIKRITIRPGGVEKQIRPGRSEYQEVVWIETTGTQWIDTGLIGKSGYKIDLKYYTNSSSNRDQTIVGCYAVNQNTPLYRGINYKSSYMSVYFNYNNTWHDIINSQAVGNTYEGSVTLRNGNQNVTLNGNTVYSATDNLSQTGTTNLFLFTSRGTNYTLIKLYYMKIYDENDNLIRDFVPCYRKRDTVIGLYDLVNDQFYTNSGTGTFTKGPDVN